MQTKILALLRSPQFFVAIVLLFLSESAWIAISAAYPMAFDENTHFGIIQIYSHQLSPLMLHQPEHADFAGALTRDPSYLYHWLMSFPYRLIAHVTSDQMIQVIDLRFINIAMFGSALVLFRRLFLKTKISPAIIHVTLLFFVLTPVVPLLAGQINYDNLIMPLVALALLAATSISDKLRKRQLPVARILGLLTLCMLSSLVQFVFLPIFTAIFLWLGWQLWRFKRSTNPKLIPSLKSGWQKTSWQRKLLVGAPFVIAISMFLQMYGGNILLYHNPLPECHEVLTSEQCSSNGAWQRNHELLAKGTAVDHNPLLYTASWVYRMFSAMFFTSSGGASQSAWYLSINPLPIIFAAALGVFLVGVFLLLKYHRRVFEGYEHIGLLLFVAFLYIAVLLLRNYIDYMRLGEKVAIQGRYLFPVILPCMIILALGFRKFFGHRAHLKMALLTAIFVLFLQGGGALSYITASNSHWYWQNRAVVGLNQAAQRVVKPLIVFKTPLRSFGSTKT